MFKLCVSLLILGLAVSLIEAQSISQPFPPPPSNPFFAEHLKRTGFYQRNDYDTNYQKNFFRHSYTPFRNTGGESGAGILTHQKNAGTLGLYHFVYETTNGIRGQQLSVPKLLKNGQSSPSVEGSYAYTSPEGLQVLLDYTADELGFRPVVSYGGVGAERYINSPEPASVLIRRISRT